LTLADAWYAAHTKPRQETTATEHLARQGYEVYLLMYKIWPKPLKRRAVSAVVAPAPASGLWTRLEPMFSRYVFFKPTCPAQSLSPARSTHGVCTLVSFGQGPAPVHTQLIEHIWSLEASKPGSAARPHAVPVRHRRAPEG
jgi:transcriptional antiterminator RfaH